MTLADVIDLANKLPEAPEGLELFDWTWADSEQCVDFPTIMRGAYMPDVRGGRGIWYGGGIGKVSITPTHTVTPGIRVGWSTEIRRAVIFWATVPEPPET